MKSPQSLGEFLGVFSPGAEGEVRPSGPSVTDLAEWKNLTAKEFCEGVVNSAEFRSYILHGITLRDLPPQVIIRIIDTAWGRPVERVEMTDPGRLEDLTPQTISEKLERVQRMLRLLQAAKARDLDSSLNSSEAVH